MPRESTDGRTTERGARRRRGEDARARELSRAEGRRGGRNRTNCDGDEGRRPRQKRETERWRARRESRGDPGFSRRDGTTPPAATGWAAEGSVRPSTRASGERDRTSSRPEGCLASPWRCLRAAVGTTARSCFARRMRRVGVGGSGLANGGRGIPSSGGYVCGLLLLLPDDDCLMSGG